MAPSGQALFVGRAGARASGGQGPAAERGVRLGDDEGRARPPGSSNSNSSNASASSNAVVQSIIAFTEVSAG